MGRAATVPSAKTGQPVWTEDRIELLIVQLLAELLNEKPDALHQSLLTKGAELPVDSLDLFDVLAEFRQQTGITLPKRRLGREVMRSVSAFSKLAAEEAQND
jgi:acyl carrier protein